MPILFILAGLGLIGFGVSKLGGNNNPPKEKETETPPVDPVAPVSAAKVETPTT